MPLKLREPGVTGLRSPPLLARQSHRSHYARAATNRGRSSALVLRLPIGLWPTSPPYGDRTPVRQTSRSGRQPSAEASGMSRGNLLFLIDNIPLECILFECIINRETSSGPNRTSLESNASTPETNAIDAWVVLANGGDDFRVFAGCAVSTICHSHTKPGTEMESIHNQGRIREEADNHSNARKSE